MFFINTPERRGEKYKLKILWLISSTPIFANYAKPHGISNC